jgi:hypothetical protein
MKTALLFALAVATANAAAAPCDGVDRSLDAAMQARLAPVVEAHLKAQLDPRVGPSVYVQAGDVLHVFRFKGWHIVHVISHATDEPYAFYARDPAQAPGYLTVWAGAAAMGEEKTIKKSVSDNAPGIPEKLAACFAWYVTPRPRR